MRSIWREMKNHFYKYDEGERLVREATSNSPGHPTPEQLRAICRTLDDERDCPTAMRMLIHRLMDMDYLPHVEKSLAVVKHLCRFGDMRIVRRLKIETCQHIQKLTKIVVWVDNSGVDNGQTIREEAQECYDLLTDDMKLRIYRGEESPVVKRDRRESNEFLKARRSVDSLPPPPPRQKKKKRKKKSVKKREEKPKEEELSLEVNEKPEEDYVDWLMPDFGVSNKNDGPRMENIDFLTGNGMGDDWVNDFLGQMPVDEEEEKVIDKERVVDEFVDDDPRDVGWVEGMTITCAVCGFGNGRGVVACQLCDQPIPNGSMEEKKNKSVTDLTSSNLFAMSISNMLFGSKRDVVNENDGQDGSSVDGLLAMLNRKNVCHGDG